MPLLLVVSLLAADPVAIAPAQVGIDWPEFRGPTHQGHTSGPVPLTWSDRENIVWRVPIEGLAWSSPVVDRGDIFLTTATEVDLGHLLRLLVVDLDDGRVTAEQTLHEQPAGVELVEMHQKNSHASPTPVLARDAAGRTVVFTHFGPHGTAAHRWDGRRLEEVWSTQTPPYLSQHGTGGSPALVGTPEDGTLVICCDGRDEQFVVGLDAATGERRWRLDRNLDPDRGFSFGTPLVIEAGGRTLAICTGSSAVMAIDPESGREVWRFRYGKGYSVVPRPLWDPDLGERGLLLVSSGFGDRTVYAIDPSGNGDITESGLVWSDRKNAPYSPSMLLADGRLYAVSDNGVATARDAATGRTLWTERLGGKFSASPLLVCTPGGDRIYWLDEAGTTIVSEAGDEFVEVARNRIGGGSVRTYASFVPVGGDLLLRTENELIRIGD